MSAITILGAGAMGTAVAHVLATNGHTVRLWDYNPATIATITKTRRNPFLHATRLHHRVSAKPDMANAVQDAPLIIIAAASPYIRSTTERLAPLLHGKRIPIIAHVAKGLESKTNATMHAVIQSVLPRHLRHHIVTLSGPSLAHELVRGIPTGMIAASDRRASAAVLQRAFQGSTVVITPATDVRGVSLCGSLKNVYAIALGMCDGMRLSMNAKALLFTAALNEMTRIIVVLGGKKETLLSLAGIGDLMVTGLGDGRNRSLGERICREGHCRFILKEEKVQTWEGVAATHAFTAILAKKRVHAPLLATVSRTLQGRVDPCTALTHFFDNKRG